MKKFKGNFLSFLNEATQTAAAVSPSAPYQMQMLDVRKIIPNKKNFYRICDIEALAAKMNVSGRISPLEVIKNEGSESYTLISGERRRAAILYRFENGMIPEPVAPCVVLEHCRHDEIGEAKILTQEEQEIISLIFANDTRRKNLTELLKEIELLEGPVRKIYEEILKKGAYSGTFRLFFAEEVLGMSETKLHRVSALRKLTSRCRHLVDEEKISISAAAELAGKSEKVQEAFVQAYSSGACSGTAEDIRSFGDSKEASAVKVEDEQELPQKTAEEKSEPLLENHVSSKDEGRDNEETETEIASNDSPKEIIEQADKGAEEKEGAPASDSSIFSKAEDVRCTISVTLEMNQIEDASEFVISVLKNLTKATEKLLADARSTGNEKTALWWEKRITALRDAITCLE